MRRGTTEARLKQEGKIPSRKERLASSAMSSEKRLGQALIMEGGIQSAGEALAGQDSRIYSHFQQNLYCACAETVIYELPV